MFDVVTRDFVVIEECMGGIDDELEGREGSR